MGRDRQPGVTDLVTSCALKSVFTPKCRSASWIVSGSVQHSHFILLFEADFWLQTRLARLNIATVCPVRSNRFDSERAAGRTSSPFFTKLLHTDLSTFGDALKCSAFAVVHLPSAEVQLRPCGICPRFIAHDHPDSGQHAARTRRRHSSGSSALPFSGAAARSAMRPAGYDGHGELARCCMPLHERLDSLCWTPNMVSCKHAAAE